MHLDKDYVLSGAQYFGMHDDKSETMLKYLKHIMNNTEEYNNFIKKLASYKDYMGYTNKTEKSYEINHEHMIIMFLRRLVVYAGNENEDNNLCSEFRWLLCALERMKAHSTLRRDPVGDFMSAISKLSL